MATKQRDANYRRAQMARDKGKKKKGPRTPKSEAYDRNKRVNVKADLNTKWGWL